MSAGRALPVKSSGHHARLVGLQRGRTRADDGEMIPGHLRFRAIQRNGQRCLRARRGIADARAGWTIPWEEVDRSLRQNTSYRHEGEFATEAAGIDSRRFRGFMT